MPERSRVTRRKLMDAGRREFAEHGWITAKIRDIVAKAEQSNDSAINYHFGSRSGLLRAILRVGIEAMEEQRAADMEALGHEGLALDSDLGVVRLSGLVIRPLADVMRTPEGVDFVRIVGQIGPYTRVEQALRNPVMQDTILLSQVEVLVDAIGSSIGADYGRHRIHNFLIALIAILSARALSISAGKKKAMAENGGVEPTIDEINERLLANGELPHDAFVEEVVTTLSAGLATGTRAAVDRGRAQPPRPSA
ncbi:TetR/AcrR family transcriptional regulator [Dietzia sp.]|uniref:TetR/AcrR family transcriptional regulator n=1 Tax=Dietzia sp. TaxID=1871616 RepID=UPI002FDA9C97